MKRRKDDTYFNENVEFDEQGRPVDNKPEPDKNPNIIGIAAAVCFAAGALLMFLFARSEGREWLSIVVFGIMFSAISALGAITKYMRYNIISGNSVIFSIIGLIIAISAFVVHGSDDRGRIIFAKLGAVMFLMIFILVGVALLVQSINKIKGFMARCTVRVTAVCSGFKDMKVNVKGKPETISVPVYEVNYREERTELEDESFAKDEYVMVGDEKELFIDPENPHVFYDPKRKPRLTMSDVMFPVLFMTFPLLALAAMITG